MFLVSDVTFGAVDRLAIKLQQSTRASYIASQQKSHPSTHNTECGNMMPGKNITYKLYLLSNPNIDHSSPFNVLEITCCDTRISDSSRFLSTYSCFRCRITLIGLFSHLASTFVLCKQRLPGARQPTEDARHWTLQLDAK